MTSSISTWLPPFSLIQVRDIAELSERVFSPPVIDFEWRLARMPDASVFVAVDSGRLIGFKAGYAVAERRYYSWLGAVHPDFRGHGIATDLAFEQHTWLANRGYTTVETATLAGNQRMARLNLKLGFSVDGSKLEPHGLKVLWSKRLP